MRTAAKITGIVIHVLIALMMIAAAMGKLFFPMSPQDQAKMGGIANLIMVIVIGELVVALLLVIPWTSSLGVLGASAFWGGAICVHMQQGDYFVLQSVLLAVTWLGALLRMPTMFSSFLWRPFA